MHMRRVVIAVNVYRETYRQMEECLWRISLNLPGSEVRIFFNGDQRADLIPLITKFGMSWATGPNLGTNSTWHIWWLRMLLWFQESRGEICFKFDPDTMVDSTPTAIPIEDYFGDLQRPYNHIPFIQGGITGLSQNAVQRLIGAGLLESIDKSRSLTEIPANASFMDDQLIAKVLRTINILPVHWLECKSRWKIPIENRMKDYAIVHPRYYN